jgi:hypothetical protein
VQVGQETVALLGPRFRDGPLAIAELIQTYLSYRLVVFPGTDDLSGDWTRRPLQTDMISFADLVKPVNAFKTHTVMSVFAYTRKGLAAWSAKELGLDPATIPADVTFWFVVYTPDTTARPFFSERVSQVWGCLLLLDRLPLIDPAAVASP